MQTLNAACRQAPVHHSSDFGSRHSFGGLLLLACDPVWQAYRPLHEKIGASPAAFAAFPTFAKSRPRDAIERARFRAAAVRERKAR